VEGIVGAVPDDHKKCFGEWIMFVLSCNWLLLGLILLSTGGESKDEWLGWRGLDKYAAETSDAGPVVWTKEEGIVWETEIPGRGNSSPVISDGRVYLTTSYEAKRGQLAKTVVDLLMFLATLIVATMSIIAFCRSCATRSTDSSKVIQLGRSVLFGIIVSLVGLLVVFAPSAIDYERCVIRSWLGSSLLLSLCFLISQSFTKSSSLVRTLCGIVLMFFGVAIVWFMPSHDHAFRRGLWVANAAVVLCIASIPLLIGIIWIGRRLFEGQADSNPKESSLNESSSGKLFARHNLFNLAGAGIVAVVGAYGINSLAWEKGGVFNWFVFWAALSFTIAIIMVYLAWFLLIDNNRRQTTNSTSSPKMILTALVTVIAVISVGAGVFYLTVQASEFLIYHFANPEWNPSIGWIGLGTLILACVLTFGYQLWKGNADGKIAPTGFGVAWILLGALVFYNTNFIAPNKVLTRAIVCLDQTDGSVVWTAEGLDGPEGRLHRYNTPATPTAVIHDDRVIAYFGSVGVMCCDLSGKTLWTNREITFEGVYGVGASPSVRDGVLVIVNGMIAEPYVCGLDCATGDTLWRQDLRLPGEDGRGSGTSRPAVIENLNGRNTAIVWGFHGLTGFDLYTGEQLWYHDIGAGGLIDLVASMTHDSKFLYCAAKRKTLALDLARLDSSEDPIVWQTRGFVNLASPVLSNGLLFMVSDKGIGTCLDAETGRKMWKARIGGEFYSSPVAIGNCVYFCNLEGKTTVFDAAASESILATSDHEQLTFASFAPTRDGMIVRTSESVFLAEAPGSLESPDTVATGASYGNAE